ncbi:hypothetical protein EON63_24710, partial [archaeon]
GVEVRVNEEGWVIDLSGPTSPPTRPEGVSGFEGALQVLHVILTDFKFERDAFQRAQQGAHESFISSLRSLESACAEGLVYSLTQAQPRLLTPNHQQIDHLSLETVERAVKDMLKTENLELTVSADLSLEEIESFVLKYVGTVPPSQGKHVLRGTQDVLEEMRMKTVRPSVKVCMCMYMCLCMGRTHII